MKLTQHNSKFFSLMLASAVGGFLLGACSSDDGKGPPVFNAIDPSLQCPSGQVGWDFTTGGNESDVLVQPVGTEIKIQDVKYSCWDEKNTIPQQDLTASFRAQCDNAKACDRPILNESERSTLGLGNCANKSLTITYKCGNEPTVYDISRKPWGRISREEYRRLVKTPQNEPTDLVKITCTDPINMKGYSFQLPNGTQSTIQEARVNCNGKRRCFNDEVIYMAASGYSSPLSKFYYTCGTSTAIREHIVDLTGGKQQYIDFSCADDLLQTGFERAPVIFFKELSYAKEYADMPSETITDLNSRLKAACEGKRECSISVPKASLPQYPSGVFKVEYWCGSSKGAVERKYIHTRNIVGTNQWKGDESISLQCGGRLRIVSSSSPWATTECPDGVRTCSLPPGEDDTRLNFFCEGLDSAMQNSTWLWNTRKYDVQYRERWIECPLESERIGIQLTGLNYDNNPTTEKPDLPALSACNGKQTCLIRPYSSRYSYRFRCPNGAEVSSVRTTVNGAPMDYLDCKPWPEVKYVREICGINARYSGREKFCEPGPSCTVDFARRDPYWADIIRGCDAGVGVGYTCGNSTVLWTTFPKESFGKTADGGFITEDGGSLVSGTVSCPYDPTPRPAAVTKKCIAASCPNNSKRNLEMDCVNDANIVVLPNYYQTVDFRDMTYRSTNTLKEGFPYVKNHWVYTPNTTKLEKSQAGTVWAYDVFKKKDGTGSEVFGFRCIVFSSSLYAKNSSAAVYGDGFPVNASILPDICFKNAAYGDLTSSWYHASRRAGVMNEQVFRNTYNLVRTMVVPAFDTKGRVVPANKNAPNPIGFFYTPATGFIDQFDYFAQQSDFRGQRQINFLPSRQMELKAVSGALSQTSFFIEKEIFNNSLSMDFDFGWNLLGDSPYHPLSDRALGRSSAGQLKNMNLRATVEMAKEDSSLPNKWIESNMAVVAAFPIGGGNAQEKKERFNAKLSFDTIKRIMSVRGVGGKKRADGWMKNNIEVNSVFKARVCIDFNGIDRAPGATAIDNKFFKVTVGGTEYSVGVTTRCTQEFPIVITRDLFPKPVLPINSAENPIDKATGLGQGGDKLSSDNDTASQQSCRRQCGSNNDCGSASCVGGFCVENSAGAPCKASFRKNMRIGGSTGFGRSVLGLKNSTDTDAPSASTTGRIPLASDGNTTGSSTNIALMNFNVLDSEEKKAGVLVTNSTRRETKMSLSRVWASVGAIGEIMDKLNKTPKPVKPWWKPGFSRPFGGKSPQPGIAFGISASAFIFAGPVSLQVEISASIAIGFDFVIKFVRDSQTIATKTDQAAYACLGTAKCLKLSTSAKSFGEANEDCNFQGGRLAEPRTAQALTEIKSAAANNDVWIGAQGVHIFDDPSCTDLSNVTQANASARLAECKRESVMQYQWINGNVSFADSQQDGVLFNQNLHTTKHGFGTLTSIANAGSPLKSGLLMKASGALESHALSNKLSDNSSTTSGTPLKTARYVCEFDGAAAYKATEFSVGPSVEVSAGVGASICWPSSAIGVCLAADFKFITTGISINYESKQIKIFDTSNVATTPRATIGGKGGIAKWEWAALTGRLAVEVRYFFGSDDYTIVSYSGVAADERELWSDIERFRRNNSN